VRLENARRAQKARRIISQAYRLDPRRGRNPVRYELLGDSVALAVLRTNEPDAPVIIRLARQLPDGRVSRLLKETRAGFRSIEEQIRYFESLYQRYGNP
jgi:hypothetical protein